MKRAIIFLSIFLFAGITSVFGADKIKVAPEVYQGISKYKQQNYAGCIQDMQKAIDNNSMDDLSLAHYYMGNAYAMLGNKAKASQSYGTVIQLNTSPGLVKYARQGAACVSDAEKCNSIDSLNGFINSGKSIHPKIIYDIQEQELQQVKTEINRSNGKTDINFDKYKYINDASDEMPTDKEIADAVKTLAKIGITPYAQNNQNQYSQLNALLGGYSNNNNDFSNLLPYFMAQNNQQGQANINPRMIQAMMQMPMNY